MPPKPDTRTKTRKQKEKNKRRTLRKRAKKAQSRRSGSENGNSPNANSARIRTNIAGVTARETGVVGSQSRRNTSRLSAPRFVSASLSARMPVGSNHLRAPAILHSTRNHQGRTFRNARRELFPGLKRQPPIYRYPPTNQTRSQVYPGSRRPLTAIEVHPFGFAEPSKSLHNSLKALPDASVPRGYRQSLLREAVAVPVQTVLAEPGQPDWGRMYNITEELRPSVTRLATVAELNKMDAWSRRNAERRTGGPATSGIVWAPSALRAIADLTQQEKDDLIFSNAAHLIPGDVGGYDRYEAIQRARDFLEREYRLLRLTPDETQMLIDLGAEHLAIRGEFADRYTEVDNIEYVRKFLREYDGIIFGVIPGLELSREETDAILTLNNEIIDEINLYKKNVQETDNETTRNHLKKLINDARFYLIKHLYLSPSELTHLRIYDAQRLIPTPHLGDTLLERIDKIDTARYFLQDPDISEDERELLIQYGREDLIPGPEFTNRFDKILAVRDFLYDKGHLMHRSNSPVRLTP